MNGSAPSRWSRYARALPTALVLGSLALLPACAGKTGQTPSTPAPKDAPAPSQTASAEPKKPADPKKPAEPAAQPKPADTTPQPKPEPVAATPKPVDSTAVAADFCKRVTDGVKAAIDADSSLAKPDEAVQKIVDKIPDETVNIAFAKKATTCR